MRGFLLHGLQSESSEEESDDGGDDVWDPQHATPWKQRNGKRRSATDAARPDTIKSSLQVASLAATLPVICS